MWEVLVLKTESFFPGGPVVENKASIAGILDSVPGWGTKSPHATRQLNTPAAITEPVVLN